MKIKRSVLIFIIITLFFLSFIYFSQSRQAKQTVTVLPTVAPTSAVLSISTHASICHVSQVDFSDPQAFIPDPNCTPGIVDTSVTQENISVTICHPGYTKTVRPPASYTNSLKVQQIIDYGYDDTNLKNYEEDHFISLELGGDPKDPKNLWPQPHPSVNEKDAVENYLHQQVCSGKMTLIEAQKAVSTNWYEVYKQIR